MVHWNWLASIAASALIAATAGCHVGSEAHRSSGSSEIQLGLKVAVPVQAGTADAKSALVKGDRRLVAVHGYATEAPGYVGVPSDYEAGFRIVADTGDIVRGPLHRAYLQRARRYALAYNRVILSREVP